MIWSSPCWRFGCSSTRCHVELTQILVSLLLLRLIHHKVGAPKNWEIDRAPPPLTKRNKSGKMSLWSSHGHFISRLTCSLEWKTNTLDEVCSCHMTLLSAVKVLSFRASFPFLSANTSVDLDMLALVVVWVLRILKKIFFP